MSIRAPASLTGIPTNQDGLVVTVGNGVERMVLSGQEICDDVLATIPKLEAAVLKGTDGRRWKHRTRENGVDLFEFSPGDCDDLDDDTDIAHALVAKTELRCHLNEVLNVLMHQHSGGYEASMKSLCGSKFERGQVLFQQRRQLGTRVVTNRNSSKRLSDAEGDAPQEALVGVQFARLRPRRRVTMPLTLKLKRTQRLLFSSCTQQYVGKHRAIHVVKTIPKAAHDQVVASDDCTALRRGIDHIALGYDIQSQPGGWGAVSQSTSIFLHAYASTVSPSQYSDVNRKRGVVSAADGVRRRETVLNPEAKQVMEILAKSLRNMETVIRRRRFGFQSFVYFPTSHSDASTLARCAICVKHFSLFRRDHFCQLCGHTVCNDCSQKCEVETRIGEVRTNRCCIQCVVRVDHCVFDDEEILPAFGPLIVDVDDDAWCDTASTDDSDDCNTKSMSSTSSSLSDSLFSSDAFERSQALHQLAQLVAPSAKKPVSPPKISLTRGRTLVPAPATHEASTEAKKQQLLRSVESHVNQSLRETRERYREPVSLPVYGAERDYNYTYDTTGDRTANPNVPLAPRPSPSKEANRLAILHASGVLDEKYDRSALELLAQVAAQKLNCPVGLVTVIDDSKFRAIASYNLPITPFVLPRDENLCAHSLYAEKPMIIKNPARDMRFAQMGCVKDMGIQFYAGFPVYAPDGSVVASLCASDSQPHHNITTKDYATMEALSKLASQLIMPKSKAPPASVRTGYPATST